MKKRILLFHHNDMDGKSAAAIVMRHFGYEHDYKLVEVNYATCIVENTDEYNSKDFDKTIIVDVSLNEDTKDQFKEVVRNAKECIWIDHHKTTFEVADEELMAVPGLRYDGYCGAYLAYAYFRLAVTVAGQFDVVEINPHIPDWIQLVDDHDTWKHQHKMTWAFKYAYDASDNDPMNHEFYESLFDESGLENMFIAGSAIFEYVKQQQARILAGYAYEAEFEGHKVLVLNDRGNSSMFGDRINDYDFVVSWRFDGEYYRYSLYSVKDDIDCTPIAKKYGGGGHAHACGFSTTEPIV